MEIHYIPLKLFKSGRSQGATEATTETYPQRHVAHGSRPSNEGSDRFGKVSRAGLSLVAIQMAILASETAFASRLEEAAQRGQSIIISIGQITAVIGIVLGGIAMSIGLSNLGKMVLTSGVIGAAATFGGPAVIDLLKEVFR